MKQQVLLLAFTGALAWSGTRSYVTPTTNISASVTFANVPAYQNLSTIRMEMRLDNIQQVCGLNSTNRITLSNTFDTDETNTVRELFGMGCNGAPYNLRFSFLGGGKVLTLEAGQSWTGVNDLLIRFIRDSTGVWVWAYKPDGTLFGRVTYPTSEFGETNRAALARPQRLRYFQVTGRGETNIAWVRFYNTSISANAIPKDSLPITAGLIAQYEFENSQNDSSGNGQNLALSSGTASYADSIGPYAPIVQASAACPSAGEPCILDASASTKFNDDTPFSGVSWRCVSCPSNPLWSSRTALTPRLRRMIAGTYTFEFTLAGQTKTVSTTIASKDAEGVNVFPSNELGTSPLKTNITSVPGADRLAVEVRRPDGSIIPAVRCTSVPCTLSMDARQKDHMYRVVRENASTGKVISVGDWQVLPTTQTAQPYTYKRPNSYSKMAGYIEPPGIPLESRRFLGRRYEFTTGEYSDFLSVAPDGAHPFYVDRTSYLGDHAKKRAWSDANGYEWLKMFYHANTNYSIGNASTRIWLGEDYFDASEGKVALSSAGVITPPATDGVSLMDTSGGTPTLVDMSVAAYNTTTADVAFTGSRQQLYIPNTEPFRLVNFVVSTPRVGGTVLIEYPTSDSTWATLTLASDTTNGLTQSGAITFTPPVNWHRITGRSTYKKYRLRITISGATTWPILSRVHGDNYSAGSFQYTDGSGNTIKLPLWRGWCETDQVGNDRITANDGSWVFDPTPGEKCSAYFKHEARMLFGWAANNPSGNTGYQTPNGDYPWTKYMIHTAAVKQPGKGELGVTHNGILLDNCYPGNYNTIQYAASVSTTARTIAFTREHTLEYGTGKTRAQYALAEALDIENGYVIAGRAYTKALNPNYYIAINGYFWAWARHVDYTFMEFGEDPTRRGWRYQANPDIYPYEYGGSAYAGGHYGTDGGIGGLESYHADGVDRYIPDNQGYYGQTVKTVLAYIDPYISYGTTAWDRSNRGPMSQLAKYYIQANKNTLFSYFLTGGAQYYQSDEVNYVSPNVFATTTGSAISRNFTLDSNGAPVVKSISVDAWPASFANSTNKLVKAGNQTIQLSRSSGGVVTIISHVWEDIPVGTPLYALDSTRAATGNVPDLDVSALATGVTPGLGKTFNWFSYFPAMDIDVGVPDTVNGIDGDSATGSLRADCSNRTYYADGQRGSRVMCWKGYTQANITASTNSSTAPTGKAFVSRRDYTKAIVLKAGSHGTTYGNVLDVLDRKSNPITLWVLRADGKTHNTSGTHCGPSVTSNSDGSCPGRVQMRAGDGMILMRQPVY